MSQTKERFSIDRTVCRMRMMTVVPTRSSQPVVMTSDGTPMVLRELVRAQVAGQSRAARVICLASPPERPTITSVSRKNVRLSAKGDALVRRLLAAEQQGGSAINLPSVLEPHRS